MAKRSPSRLTARKLRQRLRPGRRAPLRIERERAKKKPSELYDFWKADYDTIK